MQSIEATSPVLSGFGECVMDLAQKHDLRTQVAIRRALAVAGYPVKDRTLANYLYGKTVVDPALPVHLASALRLNKKERRQLADAYTFGQPARGSEVRGEARLRLVKRCSSDPAPDESDR